MNNKNILLGFMFVFLIVFISLAEAEDFLTLEYVSDKIITHTVLLVDAYINALPGPTSIFPNGRFKFNLDNGYQVDIGPAFVYRWVYRTIEFAAPSGRIHVIFLDGPTGQPSGNINPQLMAEAKSELANHLSSSNMGVNISKKHEDVAPELIIFNLSSLTDFERFIDLIYKTINATVGSRTQPGTETISPDEASSKVKDIVTRIKNIELEEEYNNLVDGVVGSTDKTKKLVYNIDGIKEIKLFSMIPVSMNIKTKVDAKSGDVISIDKPWWSFLSK